MLCIVFADLRLKWRRRQDGRVKATPRTVTGSSWQWFLSPCGFPEADAELKFGVRDIYEGLTPVEGRGRSRVGQREEPVAQWACGVLAGTPGSFRVFMAHWSGPGLG